MRIPAESPTIKLMYQLRRLSLREIDRTIASYHGPAPITSQLRRFRNIINQSDPEDIFGHLNANRLEKLVLGYADGTPLPKYLTGQGGSPDKNLFNSLRQFFSANIHHGNPLAQNTNAIHPKWDDNDLYTFHRTLNKLGTGAGSSKKGLINAIFKEHLSVFHKGGTKVDEFPPVTQFDPELAAAEFMINNSGNQQLIDDFKANPNTMTKRVVALFEQNPTMNQKGFLKSLNRLSLPNQFVKLGKTEKALANLADSGGPTPRLGRSSDGDVIGDSRGRIRFNAMARGTRGLETGLIASTQLREGDITGAALTTGQGAALQYMQTAHGKKALAEAARQILKERAAKTTSKLVPGVDVGISAWEVKNYLEQGKFDQAFIAGLSGLVGWVPGKGDLISAGLDLYNTNRDIQAMYNEAEIPETQTVPEQQPLPDYALPPEERDEHFSNLTSNLANQPQ